MNSILVPIVCLGFSLIMNAQDERVLSRCHKVPSAVLVKKIWDVGNKGAAVVSVLEGVGAVCDTLPVYGTVPGAFIGTFFRLEAANHLVSSESLNTRSVLLPAVLTVANGTECFLRLFTATEGVDPLSSTMHCAIS